MPSNQDSRISSKHAMGDSGYRRTTSDNFMGNRTSERGLAEETENAFSYYGKRQQRL
jgi:hypothetical protein